MRLELHWPDGEAYQAVLHDCAEGVAWFGVSALTVIFDESVVFHGRQSRSLTPLGILKYASRRIHPRRLP
jgi:hypothetical protein